ncbi:MAG: flagellar hook-length control protein FliK [Moorellales bacterium]
MAQVAVENPAAGLRETPARESEADADFAACLALLLFAPAGLAPLGGELAAGPNADGLGSPASAPPAGVGDRVPPDPFGPLLPADARAAGSLGEETAAALVAAGTQEAQTALGESLGKGSVEPVAEGRLLGSLSGDFPVTDASEVDAGAGRVPPPGPGFQTEGRNSESPERFLAPGAEGQGPKDRQTAGILRPDSLGTRQWGGVEAQAAVKEAGGREVSAPTGGAEAAAPEALLARELVERGLAVWQHGYGYMRLKLKPEFLGQVELQVSSRLGRLVAQVVVESEVVRNLVQASFAHLRDNLAQYGLSLERLSVEVGGNGNGSTGSQFPFQEPGHFGRPAHAFGWSGGQTRPQAAGRSLLNCLA